MPCVLEFKDVSLNYHTKTGETRAIEKLDFCVDDGEFVALIGPSGCGKTSILSLAAGLIPPSGGTIEKNSKDFGYMLQKDELFPWRTIKENIFLPLEIKKRATAENKQYALNLAEKYGLKDFLNSYPRELSGGMRQRSALIRTLSIDPQILLLDEPFSALDYQTRLSVCDDVHKIIKSEKKTALLVTHDISEAIALADKIIVLSKRPSKIVSIHKMPYSDLEPLRRREEKTFSEWFEMLWKELNK